MYGFEHLTQLHPGFTFAFEAKCLLNAWDRFCDVILLSDERLYPLYAFKYSDYGALAFFINDDRIHPKELSRWFLCSSDVNHQWQNTPIFYAERMAQTLKDRKVLEREPQDHFCIPIPF